METREVRRWAPGTGIAGLRRYTVLFAVALVAFALIEVGTFAAERWVERWQDQSRLVSRLARDAELAALERDAAVYRILMSGGQATLGPAQRADARLGLSLDSLIALSTDNASQQARARGVQSAVAAWNAGFVAPALAGTLVPAQASERETEFFAPVRTAFAEFLAGEAVQYEDRRHRGRDAAVAVLVAMLLPGVLLAGLVIASGRRFAGQADALAGQQELLEQQAVELEQQVHELEVTNTELAEAMDAERIARGDADREGLGRLRNAALLDAAMQSSPIGISLLDTDLRYVMVNDAIAKITGIAPAAHVGRTLRDVNPVLDPEVEAALRSVLATEQPIRDLELLRTVPGDQTARIRHLLLNVYPVRIGDSRPIGLGIAAVDTTDQRDLLEQFHHAQKLEAVGRLAAGIAHDFNNLLTVIRSYCDLVLLEMPPDAAMRAEIQEIRAAGERAAALSRQMLALSRKQAILPRALAVGEAIAEMEPMLRRVTEGRVELRVDLETPLGIVHIDPTQLEQVVMNLVINAVDAMPKGGEILIAATNVTVTEADAKRLIGLRPGAHVAIVVRDNGTGIEPRILNSIFDPFFTTKPPGKGTGLGLSTVYGIVRAAGGVVLVESELDVGTSFTTYLPAEVQEQAAAVRTTAATAAHAGANDGSETILLVEDEDVLRSMLSRILRRRGYTVIEAAHGGEAMRLSLEHGERFQLVLSDFHMPGMHGRELVGRLREQRPDMRVLFMSGSGATAGAVAGSAEQHAFIQKPFTVDELAAKIRSVLDA